ncbi:MAG: HAD family hydrolase [Lachnospiraceae bacterium]|nr:HAD family hydrolase [Lachnospiraceae bacterium]
MRKDTLYITDLDGTLLNRQVEVTKTSACLLNECIKNGTGFTVATARTHATVEKILQDVNVNWPVILMNGALIYDLEKKEYVKIESIAPTLVEKLCGWMHQYGIYGFLYTVENNRMCTYYEKLATESMQKFYRERKEKYNKQFRQVRTLNEAADKNAVYISMNHQKEKLEPVFALIKQEPGLDATLYQDIYEENRWYLEVFSHKASKKNGASFLREYTGADTLIGFGDNLNDLSLFEACDITCAVENANATVKEQADYVIDSNEEDGVAKWIYESTQKNK